MQDLRTLIREKEYAWRLANEPEFAALEEAERWLRLRPTILTFSRHIVYVGGGDEPTLPNAEVSPESYRDSADIFFYDEYPYKASQAELQQWVNDGKIAQEVLNRTVSHDLLQEQVKDLLLHFT